MLAPSLNLRDLRQRLKWLMLYRVILAASIGAGFALLQVTSPRPLFSESTATGIVSTLLVAYILNLAYIYIYQRAVQSLPLLAYAQLTSDVVVSGFLIMYTGRFESPVFFLIALNVLCGAIMLYREGAWYVVVLTIGGLLLLCIYETSLINFSRVQSANSTLREILTNGLVNAAIVCFVAILSGHMSELLRTAHIRLRFADADLKTLQRLNEHLLISAHSGILYLNERGEILYLNQAAEHMFEVESAQVISKPIHTLCTLLPHPLTLESLNTLNESEHAITTHSGTAHRPIGHFDPKYWEHTLMHPHRQPRTISCSLSPLKMDEESHEGWVLIAQEITELKRLEVNIRRNEHLASIGEMAAQIAHEVRNPLASMSNSLQLLRGLSSQGGPRGETEGRLLNIMDRETERLSILTQDFLDFARPPKPQAELVSINMALADIFSLKSETLTLDIQDECEAWVDVSHLTQIAWNLIQNADQAKSSAVTIRGRVDTGVPQMVSLSFLDEGEGLPGPPESLFQPFFTTRERGTGLGLSVCRMLAEANGGSLRGSNRPEGGAKFELKLLLEAPSDLSAERTIVSATSTTISQISPDQMLVTSGENI
jgi:two-component system, NtrC family, sensor histidine kinase PilS